MSVTAVMLMGAKREPFLAACLESIHAAVDRVVLNDNSGLAEHDNLAVVKQSKLFREGRITLVNSSFLGFGPCRDLCLAEMRQSDEPDRWVIFVDCDEVHYPSLARVTRDLLPGLPEDIGIVDGYCYQIYQSPRLLLSLDHRHNLMFRFRPEIRWEGKVHEQIDGLIGQRLVIPYRYLHYGMLADAGSIAEKWQMYGELGDPVSGGQSREVEKILREDIKKLTWYYGGHPAVADAPLAEYERQHGEFLAQYEALAAAQTLFSLKSRLRHWQLAGKMRWLLQRARRQVGRSAAAVAALSVY